MFQNNFARPGTGDTGDMESKGGYSKLDLSKKVMEIGARFYWKYIKSDGS